MATALENARDLTRAARIFYRSAATAGRILVVDDERLMLSCTERILRRLGYAVVSCAEPKEALEIFRREPDSYDAVITDYLMPGMSGVQLSQRILSMRPGLRVLMLTGCTGDLDPDRVRQVGIRAVLSKPATSREFRTSLS